MIKHAEGKTTVRAKPTGSQHQLWSDGQIAERSVSFAHDTFCLVGCEGGLDSQPQMPGRYPTISEVRTDSGHRQRIFCELRPGMDPDQLCRDEGPRVSCRIFGDGAVRRIRWSG